MASEPCLPWPSSPYRRIPCFSANSRCFTSSWFATSSSPSCTRSGDMASLRKVRWSRKKSTDSGSSTRSFSPTSCSKKIADMGVTYSCEKRMSVCTKPESPGCTHGTPTEFFDKSVTQCREKIFSAMVMGRRPAACRVPSGAPSESVWALEVEVATNCAAAASTPVPGPGALPAPLPRSARTSSASVGCGASPGWPWWQEMGGVLTVPWSRATL